MAKTLKIKDDDVIVDNETYALYMALQDLITAINKLIRK